jgi:hypothetical protein
MKATPVMANQMLAVGRTIWDWAIPVDLAKANPFDKVRDLDVPDRGHVPWPAWAVDYVRGHARPDLVRMVRLGVMICQRGSDMIRMGPEHREDNGIWCRPRKTRKHVQAERRALHAIPRPGEDRRRRPEAAEAGVQGGLDREPNHRYIALAAAAVSQNLQDHSEILQDF